MKSAIRICEAWESIHDCPVYTLSSTCPDCGGPAVNSAPAPYNPEDPHGEYRRALKRRESG
jgi:H/ACA ribonucleoprotein complex subunit 3